MVALYHHRDSCEAAQLQCGEQGGVEACPLHTCLCPRSLIFLLLTSLVCSRYVNVSSCNYIVDLDGPWQAEEHYTLRSDFSVVASLPFMRASATPAHLRWLWMPEHMLGAAAFDSYVLLQKKDNAASH